MGRPVALGTPLESEAPELATGRELAVSTW